jgi:hypothetical protein
VPKRLIPLLLLLGAVVLAHGCTATLAWRAGIAPGSHIGGGGAELRRDHADDESGWRRVAARERRDPTLIDRGLTPDERRDMETRIERARAYNRMLGAMGCDFVVTALALYPIAAWWLISIGWLAFDLVVRRGAGWRRHLTALGIGAAATAATWVVMAYVGISGAIT